MGLSLVSICRIPLGPKAFWAACLCRPCPWVRRKYSTASSPQWGKGSSKVVESSLFCFYVILEHLSETGRSLGHRVSLSGDIYAWTCNASPPPLPAQSFFIWSEIKEASLTHLREEKYFFSLSTSSGAGAMKIKLKKDIKKKKNSFIYMYNAHTCRRTQW